MEIAALLYTISLLLLVVLSVYDALKIDLHRKRIELLEKQVKRLAKRKVATDGQTSVKKRA
jgi:hypothetical protein